MTQPDALSGESELLFLNLEDVFHHFELPLQTGPLHGRSEDIGRQRQSRSLQPVLLVITAGGQGLQRAAIATGQVKTVLSPQTGTQDVELSRAARLPHGDGIKALALSAQVGADFRIVGRASLCGVELPGLAQGRFGGNEGRVALQGLADKGA